MHYTLKKRDMVCGAVNLSGVLGVQHLNNLPVIPGPGPVVVPIAALHLGVLASRAR